MNTFIRDVRYSARLLWNKRGYTAVVVLTLMLGIGAVNSVFSVVNAVLLQSYGPVNTDRWVYLWEQRMKSTSLNQISVSMPNIRDWRQDSGAIFSDIVVWLPWSYTVSGPGLSNPELVRAAVISPEIFSAVGAAPAAGRLLNADDAKNGERRVVLSYEFWRHAYGADPTLPGKTITLNSAAHTVVGIAPPGFSFPPEQPVDVWTALSQSAISAADRSFRSYRVAAKLKPGVTSQTAQSVLNVISERLAGTYPEDKQYGALVIPMREGVAGDFRAPLVALSGALGFALLLLCVNIAYLRLVHLEARRKEIALRVALGARRTVLIRQLFMETVLLFGIGGGLGILIAPVGVRLLLSFVPAEEIPWLHMQTDGLVLLGSLAVTFVAATVSGLIPAMRASRLELASSLAAGGKVTGTGGINRRLRDLIIVPQIALALVPLCGAGLLIRSFARLQQVAPGFNTQHRLTLAIVAPKSRYQGPAEITALAKRLREATLQIPGVREVGLAQAIPFTPGLRWLQAVTRSDPKGLRNFSELPLVRYTVTTPGYFEAMGIALKAGRLLTDADVRGAQPVAVINEKFARQYFKEEDPIGKQIWMGHSQSLPHSSPRIIVGVTADTHMYALERDADPAAWVAMAQQDIGEDIWRSLYLVVDTGIKTDGELAAVRQRIHSVDAELATSDVKFMEERLRDSLWRPRFSARVLGAFGLAALGIAVLGVFGVTSYLVARRSHEIGVRMAVGASRANILKMVLGQGLLQVAIGITVGLAGAFALTRVLEGLLFGVKPDDPLTFGIMAGILVSAAAMACLVPAWRAAKVDPVVALRAE